MNYLYNFEKFQENEALFDWIVVIYQLMRKQIFPMENE